MDVEEHVSASCSDDALEVFLGYLVEIFCFGENKGMEFEEFWLVLLEGKLSFFDLFHAESVFFLEGIGDFYGVLLEVCEHFIFEDAVERPRR